MIAPFKALPLGQAYRLLEPGPVVFLATARKGIPNVMTMSWHTMMEFEPPLVGCVLGDRDYSFETLRKTKECVIAVPAARLARTVVAVGNTSGRSTDKFSKFHLTPLPAKKVAAPLIKECFANLECRVVDTSLVNTYGFFVLEVVQAWIDPAQKDVKTVHHRGRGVFAVDGKILKLPSKMK